MAAIGPVNRLQRSAFIAGDEGLYRAPCKKIRGSFLAFASIPMLLLSNSALATDVSIFNGGGCLPEFTRVFTFDENDVRNSIAAQKNDIKKAVASFEKCSAGTKTVEIRVIPAEFAKTHDSNEKSKLAADWTEAYLTDFGIPLSTITILSLEDTGGTFDSITESKRNGGAVSVIQVSFKVSITSDYDKSFRVRAK